MDAPTLPEPTDSLDIGGFSIGHGTDAQGMTGVTVILCPGGATAAADLRGTATGTRQFDSLVTPTHLAQRVHGVVLAGQSAFGLSAAEPVVERLAREGHGFDTGFGVVPVVPTAILFDLGFGGRAARPLRALAEEALADARRGQIEVGSVGCGTGATVGKAAGLQCGMKGGFGFASVAAPGGPTVAAAVAVNAFGDVRDPTTGGLVAGCRVSPGAFRFADARRVLAALPAESSHPWEGNTTLAVVMTDAAIDKVTLSKICEMSFGALYRCISPAATLYDGDLLVALATGEVVCHPHRLAVLAEEAIVAAVLRGVRSADGFGLIPAVVDLAAG